MTKLNGKSMFLATVVLSSLCAACSGGNVAHSRPENHPGEFSDEAKSAARALSITQVKSVTAASSPYAKALLCKNGLDATAQRLQDLTVLSAQQRQLLQQAQGYFDRQLHDLGAQQGLSAAAIDNDLRQTSQSHPDAEENARIAVACLQGLQEAG